MDNAENIETRQSQAARHSLAAQELLKNLNNALNEEKWTRAALSNYSTSQFKELDDILKSAKEEKITDEIKKNCDEHLSHTRKSIIALYISGMIALSRQIIDDSAIVDLVSMFLDNHKWNIVKYLCEKILEYGESKFALRTIADCYKNDNEEQKIYGVWERLVKVDYEEAEIAKQLAEHYEKQGAKEKAVDFYKKALHRFINKGNFPSVKEIWEKLIIINIEDIEYFMHIQNKIAKQISEDKAVVLLYELYNKYKDINIDTAINILKIALEYDEKDTQSRREIVECYKKKYARHSQLDEYIRISNIAQNYRGAHQAISDFEKHIAFDKGNFVFHRTWGVGKIAEIKGDDIRIDFAKKRGHTMSLKMAVDALQTLSKDHIWVLKATKKRDELREKIKDKEENIVWALKTIIKSFDNACDMKRIKAELSPALLTSGEWTTWNSKARDILKSNPDFGVSAGSSDVFTVRDRPIEISEKLFNEFSASKNFYDKISVIRDYVNNKNADADSEYFMEMFSFFTSIIKQNLNPKNQADEDIAMASCLLLAEITDNNNYSHFKAEIKTDFAQIFKIIKNVCAVFKNIKDAKLKNEFLKNIKLHIKDWPSVYVKLFPYAQIPGITRELEDNGYAAELSKMCVDCFENLRENREAAVWLYKNARDKDWFKNANLSREKLLISLIHILDLTYRDIENNKDTVENRKINKLVYNILFKDGELASFFNDADENAIIRVFSFINDIKDLEPQDKAVLRSKILNKRPDFKFFGDAEKKVSMGLIVTKSKYEEKTKQLDHIMDVEVPANSKEIEYALSLGDLRENAEFKAAKEKQEQLNSQVAKLKEEIERAQLFDANSINTSKVSFGTKVTLRNETEGKQEEYTILGPWESDPDNNIISYLSPFGSAILNKTEGERFQFVINDGKVTYLVDKIMPAAIMQ